jgi:hypothetical protein
MHLRILPPPVHPNPDEINDPLISRSGAAAACAGCRDRSRGVSCRDEWFEAPEGRERLVWHAAAARAIQTGIGAVEVARVKTRERAATRDVDRIRWLGDRAAVGTADKDLSRTFAGTPSAGHLGGWLSRGVDGCF